MPATEVRRHLRAREPMRMVDSLFLALAFIMLIISSCSAPQLRARRILSHPALIVLALAGFFVGSLPSRIAFHSLLSHTQHTHSFSYPSLCARPQERNANRDYHPDEDAW